MMLYPTVGTIQRSCGGQDSSCAWPVLLRRAATDVDTGGPLWLPA